MKSKRQSKSTDGKQLNEPPVFFLDRTFGKNKLADILRPAGFCLVTHFEEYGDEGHSIGDDAIIHDCGMKGRVLMTGDKHLPFTYAAEIKVAGIAAFIVTENNEGPAQWGSRIVLAKNDIWRELKRRRKPFTATISREGRVTQVRIHDGKEWKTVIVTKRNPPHENKYKAKTNQPISS